MRNAVFCAAGIAVALVLAEQVVAGSVAATQQQTVNVERALKGDREVRVPTVVNAPPAAISREAPTVAAPSTQKTPEGCETGISPLAKSAATAPAALCLS
jgi:hypothetical protein